MASYFELELDTTPPVVAVVAPRYTIPNIDTMIRVEASVSLASDHIVYVVDAQGQRHDLIFAHAVDHFDGLVNVCNMALGIATIYARVRDEAFNPSDVAMATMEIKESANLLIALTETIRRLDLVAMTRAVDLTASCRQIVSREYQQPISTEVVIRQ